MYRKRKNTRLRHREKSTETRYTEIGHDRSYRKEYRYCNAAGKVNNEKICRINASDTRAGGAHRAAGSRSKRRIFSMAAWSASFIMVINMLPADSRISHVISKYEENLPALSSGLEELKNGPGNSKISEIIITDDEADKVIEVVETENTVSKDDESQTQATTGHVQTAVLTKSTAETTKTVKVSSAAGSGDILIYHTHATEAYAPVATAQTTHSTGTAGTVREAANNLTASLKAKGYNVIHDTTLHDSPSYNKSYNRSLETLKKLLSEHKSPKLVIDFHRDAATSSGKPKTTTVNGETIASFALVVGTKNDNYKEIRAFADKIEKKANELYPGLCTGIIEKPYKFNGYLSNNYILLELGNNANTITQVNAAVPYIADTFTNVIQ